MVKIPFLQRSASNAPPGGAHMTWASRTVSGSVVKTREFLTRQLWVWPIIAVTLLLLLGWGVNSSIERTMKSNLESELVTLRDVEVAMLRNWMKAHKNSAESVAGDTDVRRLVAMLREPSSDDPELTDGDSPGALLTKQLGPAMSSHDYE
ncbi:MAG: serine/threonine protein kinase, partial [Aeoliella sp.]